MAESDRRRTARTAAFLAGASLASSTLTACGSGTFTGTLVLKASQSGSISVDSDGSCHGTPGAGYEDLAAGAVVKMEYQSASSLDWEEVARSTAPAGQGDTHRCVFSLTLSDVPEHDDGDYRAQMADRGLERYTLRELEKGFTITIDDDK